MSLDKLALLKAALDLNCFWGRDTPLPTKYRHMVTLGGGTEILLENLACREAHYLGVSILTLLGLEPDDTPEDAQREAAIEFGEGLSSRVLQKSQGNRDPGWWLECGMYVRPEVLRHALWALHNHLDVVAQYVATCGEEDINLLFTEATPPPRSSFQWGGHKTHGVRRNISTASMGRYWNGTDRKYTTRALWSRDRHGHKTRGKTLADKRKGLGRL
ncbi:hypothetical protein CMI37_20155 [Candidatus Pacearchaeota archaeon]|nr:hypothetical protein [Candidatus Pacearchaeota archaeon]|tara:strand:+ start:887 stop:1534 length:648 start_codon:yes stop_codon:yes gene_type:complete